MICMCKTNIRILAILLICIFLYTGCSDDECTVHFTIEGKGTISLNDTQYDSDASVKYEINEIVSVKYNNSYDDWEFEQFTGDLTGTSNYKTLTMNSDKHFTAIFSLENSVEIDGYVYDSNNVSLQGVIVTSGSGSNQVTATTDSNGFYSMSNVPVPTDKKVYLYFEKDGFDIQSYYFYKEKAVVSLKSINLLRNYNLIVLNNFYNNGSTAPIPAIYTITENKVQTLSASHDDTLTFDKWSGNVPTSEDAFSDTISITMDQNRIISADFLQYTTYAIQVNWDDRLGTVSQTPDGITHVQGSLIQLSNTPEDGYVFSHWLNNQGQTFNTKTISFSLNENVTYTCVFNNIFYQLTVNMIGEGAYKIEPESDTHLYIKDTPVTLTAIPAMGWIFRRFQGSISSSYQQAHLIMDSNKTVTLVFECPNATFLGQVTQASFGDGLANTKVFSGNQSTVTDADGYFILKVCLPENSDRMTILFQKKGFCLHSATYSVYDQIEINVFPQLNSSCNLLTSIIQTLKILTGQSSEGINFDIDTNNRSDLSEIIFMLNHLAEK